MQRDNFQISNFYFAIGLILLMSFALLFQVSYLMWGEWSFDQGFYLLFARLMDHGYQSYTEIHMSEPPLMVWSTALPLRIFGTVEAMKLVMVFYAMLAIVATASIGVSISGKLAGLLAGAFLAFNLPFFIPAHSVVPGIPSMSLALLSLAFALRYRSSGHQYWVVLSGLFMAGSLQIKYFMPWMIPLLVLIITLPPRRSLSLDLWLEIRASWKKIITLWFLWGGALLLATIISWLAFDVVSLVDQTILFHLFKSSGTESSRLENVDKIINVFKQNSILSVVAFGGLLLAFFRFKISGWIQIIWLGLALLFLMIYTPLRSKHLIILIPILGVLAASLLSFLLTFSPRQTTRSNVVSWGSKILAVVLIVMLVVDISRSFSVLSKPLRLMVNEETQPLVDLLGRFTSPSDCLITDNPYLAFVSDRMPPPWLSNLSYARFDSGSLDTENLVEITNNYNCQVMAPILDRIKNANRPYYDWAKANYLRVWILDGNEIMLGKPLAGVNPMLPLDANFSDQVHLLGADWHPGEDRGYLSLYWQTHQPFSENYKIFVQLRDQSGQTVTSADHEAYDGLVPTQLWRVNTIFKDTNLLAWSSDITPGEYSLYVGLYHPVTGERLPIVNDTSGENAVIIPGIVIE